MLAHLVAAAMLAATPPVPPPPLPDLPEEPVVTELGNVAVAWSAGEFPQIRVSWDEPAPMRNRVAFVTADGAVAATGPTLEPGDVNRATLHPGLVGTAGVYRVAVWEIDAAGATVGAPALSPAFDNDRPPAVTIDAVEPRADGTVLLRWTPRPPAADVTPGDPLDLPVEQQRVVPVAATGDGPPDELAEPVTGTSFVVPAGLAAPYALGVQTVNEWGATVAVTEVRGTAVTAAVPARVAVGARVQVTGTVTGSLPACKDAACTAQTYPDAGRAVHLEARTGAQAAWTVVGTARTTADGGYRFSVVSPGTRQYRVVAPPVSWADKRFAQTYAASAAVTTTAAAPPVAAAVSGKGGGLPITGAPAAATAGTGVGLILFGVLLCVAGRRRPVSAPGSPPVA